MPIWNASLYLGMGLKQTIQSINQIVDEYELLLNRVSEEEFKQTPAEGVWSYSEVFSHIFRSNLLSFKAIERCSRSEGVEDHERTKLKYRLVLFFRSFPPNVRWKVPAKLAHLVEKISKEEARQLINDFRAGLKAVEPDIRNASPYQKVKHPRMELLNAEQWLIFTQIHTGHHAKQLKRIKKMFDAVNQ